jgi:hypothetical protein
MTGSTACLARGDDRPARIEPSTLDADEPHILEFLHLVASNGAIRTVPVGLGNFLIIPAILRGVPTPEAEAAPGIDRN